MKKMTINLRVFIILLACGTILLLPEKADAQMLQQTETLDTKKENFSSHLSNIQVVKYTYTPAVAVASKDTAAVQSIRQDVTSFQKLGFLPDELERAFPNTVRTDGNNNKNVDYTALIPVMFKIIQEQDEKIKALELKLNISKK
ncbi:MAG: hypothetical protein ACOCVN_00070 [bacterium]